MNTYGQTLAWYRKNRTTKQIGFNPDGMCLKICRTARGLPNKYPSAKAAQDATPKKYRVTDISKLRAGMVIYYDDPNDSNRFGHIVTMIGRVKNADKNKLSDILVVSNSVKKGELVTVRGDYFPKYWGDPFVFGANWLNGKPIDHFKPATNIFLFKASGPSYDMKLLKKAAKKRPSAKKALAIINAEVKSLNSNPKFWRIRKVKTSFRDKEVLELATLDAAVEKGFRGKTRISRDKMKAAIASLPER